VCDIENETLPIDGEFDAILMFGVLYHLIRPYQTLKRVCDAAYIPSLLLLSTIVLDKEGRDLVVVHESDNRDQALGGAGCRISPNYIDWAFAQLSYSFKLVPQHNYPDYQWSPQNDGQYHRNGISLRRLFVGEPRWKKYHTGEAK
jgi:hypothetical protein